LAARRLEDSKKKLEESHLSDRMDKQAEIALLGDTCEVMDLHLLASTLRRHVQRRGGGDRESARARKRV